MRLSDHPKEVNDSQVVLDWVVGEETCEEAGVQSTCGPNTNCSDSSNGPGYRCFCKEGFQGNPYLPQGCQDIDECKEPQKYPCTGTCKNTPGNYTCRCPLGMHGDGRVGCEGFRITTIAAVAGAITFIAISVLFIFIESRKRNKEKNFRQNGGLLLKHQRLRIFSAAELEKATNNYDDHQLLGQGGSGSVYKGVLADGTLVAVKKPKDVDANKVKQFQRELIEEFQHEIGIVSQVNHKNVVKLLGLCLETKVPVLVYEFVSNGTLFHHIHERSSKILRSWKNRLRIAAETALALEYLHSLADPPIIHRDVKSMNILLDENFTAKVSDFGASVLIPLGQTGIATIVLGTPGYLDPEYLIAGNLTTKSDVYSFGVVLMELVTGERPTPGRRSGEKRNIIQYFISSIENNLLFQILNVGVIDEGEKEQIEAVAELAKRCLNRSGKERPTMQDVAEELTRLRKLNENLCAQKNSQETESLLAESSSHSCFENATAYPSQSNTFDMEQGLVSVD